MNKKVVSIIKINLSPKKKNFEITINNNLLLKICYESIVGITYDIIFFFFPS